MSEPQWAIAYHSNSTSKRARKWYRVSRLILADSIWFELYWHPEPTLRGDNAAALRKSAQAYGLKLLPGVYRTSTLSRLGSAMERAL
jgi:hypothetical protein